MNFESKSSGCKSLLVKISLLLFLMHTFSCNKSNMKMISVPAEEYRMVKTKQLEDDKVGELYEKSDKSFIINWETGDFKGKIGENSYEGKYLISKIQSGFSKGFNYEMTLEALSYEPIKGKSAEKFIEILSSCTSIFVAPNRLYKPSYTSMEIKTPKEAMSLVLLNAL